MLANTEEASLSSPYSHRSYNNIDKSIHHHPINCRLIVSYIRSIGELCWSQPLNDVVSQVSIVRHNHALESCIRIMR
jgi:hypothetical protein